MSTIGLETTPLRHFITRSSYEGAWNKEVNMMDGFGTYRYPDGSEYRGRFHHGKFHGFGHLRLAQPYRFTIKGVFNHGKLVSIEDMWFPDGLHVQGQFTGNDFDASDWDYLTPQDRRYQAERRYGQTPVGPTAYVTNSLKSRQVPKDCYDVEEGIYNPKTGWLMDRPPPFTSSIYVGCTRDKDWILRHCRHARTEQVREPIPYFCRRIIANNLVTELAQLPKTDIYAPNARLERQRYYHKLCKEKGKPMPRTDPSAMELTLPANCNPSAKARATEQCLRAYERIAAQRELEEFRDLQTYHFDKTEKAPRGMGKPRKWTSSSDVQRVDSIGASSCRSDSFAWEPIPLDIKETYATANAMMSKKVADNFNVVQSNMLRRSSLMEQSRSVFEL
ncbi:uncharacterized protein LOC111081327 [Drosophila obscura]|uniref:uncharacterized protein LOC111081327 n=1 Tax=Drosophila obscura TaxID=7282 RepID=UPI001BB2CC59|nr:uncharacterized protein LOC111081327 [Drosophila obscura]